MSIKKRIALTLVFVSILSVATALIVVWLYPHTEISVDNVRFAVIMGMLSGFIQTLIVAIPCSFLKGRMSLWIYSFILLVTNVLHVIATFIILEILASV